MASRLNVINLHPVVIRCFLSSFHFSNVAVYIYIYQAIKMSASEKNMLINALILLSLSYSKNSACSGAESIGILQLLFVQMN